jgi:lipopolysaccharide biosynthesis glycosyltransferase/predicted Zn-dependent protease
MTVAAFFRDERVQTVMSGPRTGDGASLVDEFFAKYSYTDCSVSQLLALSDLAIRCGNLEVTRQALQLVFDSGTNLHLAHYRLGRLLLTQSQPEDAFVQFERGIAADENFAHNYMGAARALHIRGLKVEAAGFAERFTSLRARPHGNDEFITLGDLGDFLFDSGQRSRALPIYALILSYGGQKPRHVVRLAEDRILAGDHAQAFDMLTAQARKTGPDPWINRALALCYSAQGEHTYAIASAWQAVQANRTNQAFIGTYVRVLGRSADAEAIEDALSRHADLLSPSDLAELNTRLHLVAGDFRAAADVLLAAAVVHDSRLYYLAFETAYAALGAGTPDIASSLADMLAVAGHGDNAVKILRIDICFRELRWEEAGTILATLPPDENERPQIVMKRLEYACFIRDAEAAQAAAARLEAVAASQGRKFLVPVFRYLAEEQDWNGIVDRALPWLDGTLDYQQVGYVLFRAAKHSRRQADMLRAIQALPEWAQRPGLRTLRNALAYDGIETVADIDTLLRDPATAPEPLLRQKLAVRREVVLHATGASPRRAVFLCTDRNYLCATVVALYGATRGADRFTDFYVVAEDDILSLAIEATLAFVEAGIRLTVVAASDVVGSADRLLGTYGLFTSGHKLASAAYFRIFFARHLLRQGRYARALYLDSDVVLTGGLDRLMDAELGSHPVAARLETPRPEVNRAILHHGLEEGRYFNSGVLLFDLRHPRMADALRASIAAVADESVTLLYHDQCALNLGFRGMFSDMDMALNFPVTEATKLADLPGTAALLHFLDRPKPWSAAYHGEAGPVWFAKWREAAAFIGEEIAVRLMAEVKD